MTLQDYITENEIDMEATESMDYLIELIHEDMINALDVEDYLEVHRLQAMIESLPIETK